MRTLALLVALLFATPASFAQTAIDAEQIRISLQGAQAHLSIESLITEGETTSARTNAPPRDFQRFRQNYDPFYQKAVAAAAGDERLESAIRNHQAKARQCDQLLGWDSARTESARRAAVANCRSDLEERRAHVDILLGATESRANAPLK